MENFRGAAVLPVPEENICFFHRNTSVTGNDGQELVVANDGLRIPLLPGEKPGGSIEGLPVSGLFLYNFFVELERQGIVFAIVGFIRPRSYGRSRPVVARFGIRVFPWAR